MHEAAPSPPCFMRDIPSFHHWLSEGIWRLGEVWPSPMRMLGMSNVKAESFSSSLLVSVIPFTFLVCMQSQSAKQRGTAIVSGGIPCWILTNMHQKV